MPPEILNNVDLQLIQDISMPMDNIGEFGPIVNPTESKGFTATMEINEIGMKTLRDLLYKSFTVTGSIEEIAREVFVNMPLGHEVVDLEFKQNRTHRKKRINKKWAKRYGYTCTVFYGILCRGGIEKC